MTKESEKHSELLALYRNTTAEINHNKALPWKLNIANAIVTGFLIAVITNIRLHGCLDYFVPFIFAAVIASMTLAFFTCFVIGGCFDKARSQKALLLKLYNKFGDNFNDIVGDKSSANLDFGDVVSFATSIIFPIFLLMLLILSVSN
jgi:hypothetical protein